MRSTLLFTLCLAGCGGGGAPSDVQGPFTGSVRLFRVSSLALPQQQMDYAADLNGDRTIDNQLGNIMNAIIGQHEDNTHVAEIVAADPQQMRVEIVSDDPTLREDDTVGVRWLGGPVGPGEQLGARLVRGELASNRVSTATSTAILRLPIFADADPVRLVADRYQIDLRPDGSGGFIGRLGGTLPSESLYGEFLPAILQRIAAHPSSWMVAFDLDRDGTITVEELMRSFWSQGLAAPDVAIGDPTNENKNAVSFGFDFTLTPCADNGCSAVSAAPSCFDRVRNGDETDIDCGGSCGVCAAGRQCTRDEECITGGCKGGRCRAPSCSDGVQDGFEIAVDCGPGCGTCGEGVHCSANEDCASNSCLNAACAPRM